MNIRKICLLSLSATLFLAGCEYVTGGINDEAVINYFAKDDGEQHSDTYSGNNNSIVELLEAKGIAVPQSHTSIYVNQLGYNASDEKKAVFDGSAIESSFNVVDADSDQVVYVGSISGDDTKIGDFSSVTSPGKYYIETANVGRSYYFTISDNSDMELFTSMLDNFYDGGIDDDNIVDACLGMDALLYAMQCNGDVFEGENHIVEQLLYMSEDLIARQGEDGSIGGDYLSTAAFCGIIGMCCNEFGKYEETIEQIFKESIESSWSWLELQECDTDAKKGGKVLYDGTALQLVQDFRI
jgi:hypothetical protein